MLTIPLGDIEILYDPDGKQHTISCRIKEYLASSRDGIAWIDSVTVEKDVQTWYCADPTYF